MRLKIVFLLALLGTASWAQNRPTNSTETLIKVWGFLKYYHPHVATGIIDWDSEFIKQLDLVNQATSSEHQMQLYTDWLSRLKSPKTCGTCTAITPSTYPGNALVDWSQSGLSAEVQNQLNAIFQNRNLEKNYYVQYHQQIKLPLFNNERKISTQALPNRSERLLALARYWNAIQYFYPYKQLMQVKWDTVLAEVLPDFERASSPLAYHLGLIKMNKYLENSNAFIASDVIFEHIGKKRIPFKVDYTHQKWKVVRFENDSLARLGKLKLNDEIVQIDGKPVEVVVEEKAKWVSSSNQSSLMVSLASTLLNGSEDMVRLSVRRNGNLIDLVQDRYSIEDFYWDEEPLEGELPWKIIDDKTIWLSGAKLTADQMTNFYRAAVGMRTLFLDLRDYQLPSGFQLADYLVPRTKVFAQMIEPTPDYIGTFNTTERKPATAVVKRYFTGITYVLIDEKTRGQAELLTMLFKGSDRIVVVGSTSSGSLGYTTKLTLPGAVTAFFTGVGVRDASGMEVQQKGIQPDKVISFSTADPKQLAVEILALTQNPE